MLQVLQITTLENQIRKKFQKKLRDHFSTKSLIPDFYFNLLYISDKTCFEKVSFINSLTFERTPVNLRIKGKVTLKKK